MSQEQLDISGQSIQAQLDAQKVQIEKLKAAYALKKKQENYEQALQAYQLVADHHPDDLKTRKQIVELLLKIGEGDHDVSKCFGAV